jgi:hypothetical protein
MLEGYFSVHNFFDTENITFTLLKDLPHVKHWWETYWEKSSIEESGTYGAEPTWDFFVDAVKEQWCDFHKIPWHNTDECCSKQSLVAEIKDKEPKPDLESDYENTGKGHIIDGDPTTIFATITIQREEPTDPEEGEHLFHSQMWVKGTPLHFIVDSGSQKNLISVEVVKQLGLLTTPHPQPYNIRCLRQGRDLRVNQQC